jgi:hypothetical protein
MADVNLKRIPPPPPPPIFELTLVLNLEEAKALRDLVNSLGGNDGKSFRGVTDDIGSALDSAGVYPTGKYVKAVASFIAPGTTNLHFVNYLDAED